MRDAELAQEKLPADSQVGCEMLKNFSLLLLPAWCAAPECADGDGAADGDADCEIGVALK